MQQPRPATAVAATAEPPALIPSVEANQGLISILALAVALGVAIHEYRRALRAEAKRNTDFRAVVSGMLTELIDEAATQLKRADKIQEQLDGNAVFGPWRRKADLAFSAMQAVRPSAPPNPKMLLILAEIEEKLDPRRDAPHIIELRNATTALRDRKTTYEAFRTRFNAT